MKVEFVSVENVQTTSPNEPQRKRSNTESLESSTKKIASKSNLKAKQNTKTRLKYRCLLCSISIPNKKAYELHRTSHENDEKHDCNLCKESFEDVFKLFDHFRKHDGKNEEPQRYQCNVCGLSFVDIKDLDSHVRLHFDAEVRYVCNLCQCSVFDVDHLVEHISKLHSDITNTKYSCYMCGKWFSSAEELMEHDQDHKKDDESLNCSECGVAFPSLISLNIHKRTHTVVRAQLYGCQKCNLRFSRSEDLHSHVRVHDGKSVFQCGLCDRMFAHSKNLTNHVRKNHSSSFDGDEIHLIDFVVEAEVEAQSDHKKLEKVLSEDDPAADGDVFELNVRDLVTRYTSKNAEAAPLTLKEPLMPVTSNVIRKLTEYARKYKCPLCELIFVKAKTLEIHCRRNHQGCYKMAQLKEIQENVEHDDSKSFPKAVLNARIVVIQKHECPSCNHTYESRDDLISHIRSDHNGEKPFKCIECAESFSTSSDLTGHVLSHTVRRSAEKKHECKFCGLAFMNLYSLGKHTKRHIGPTTESCSICNIPYREKKDLVKHMRTHADGKPHKCSYCDRRFAQSCDRQKHMRIHTGERPYKCDVCGKSFAHLTSYKKHKFVHTGERAFQCTVCGKSFQHSSNLVVHNRVHTGERPYECKVCQKKFYASGHYVDHMKIHLGIKNYECQVCNKSFIHLSSFQKHKRVHSGEKPYTCQHCNRAFSQSGHFREHMMIHSGEKPHKCDICEKTFRRSDALQCHKKTHKKEMDKIPVVESKPADILATYPITDISYLPNHNVAQYNDEQNHEQIDQDRSVIDQRNISQLALVSESDMTNIESSTVTMLRPHQTDIAESAFNTFNYNFIL